MCDEICLDLHLPLLQQSPTLGKDDLHLHIIIQWTESTLHKKILYFVFNTLYQSNNFLAILKLLDIRVHREVTLPILSTYTFLVKIENRNASTYVCSLFSSLRPLNGKWPNHYYI